MGESYEIPRPLGGAGVAPTRSVMAFVEPIPVRSSPTATITVLSIIGLGAIAIWDERRESAAALDDFAAEQAVLARSVAHPRLPLPW